MSEERVAGSKGYNVYVLLGPWIFSQDYPEFGFTFVFTRRFELLYAIPNPELIKLYPSLLESGEIDIPLEKLTECNEKSVLLWDDGVWVPLKKINR